MADDAKKRRRKWLAAVLLLSFCGFTGNYYLNPLRQSAAVGQELNLSDVLQGSLWEYVSWDDGAGRKEIKENLAVQNDPGEMNFSLKLFGLIPLKQVSVAVLPETYLYPGGQSIGILLRTDGVLAVGFSPIINEKGRKSNPAEEAGINLGDVITAVNDKSISTDDQLAEMINAFGAKGEEITLEIDRAGKQRSITLEAAYCTESRKWRIGLLVKDNAGGIGTLSFVDQAGNYGALGHMVAESNTGDKLNISLGKLVHASIDGINKGERGNPGEKLGSFSSNKALGDIDKNTDCGIFGKINDWNFVKQGLINHPLPVGFGAEIKQGAAEILTVVEGEKVGAFEVEIVKIMPNAKRGKELVIKVTDERLLGKTGGIVQGMCRKDNMDNTKNTVNKAFFKQLPKAKTLILSIRPILYSKKDAKGVRIFTQKMNCGMKIRSRCAK